MDSKKDAMAVKNVLLERLHQEKTRSRWENKGSPSFTEEIVITTYLCNELAKEYTTKKGDEAAKHIIRKLAAVCIRCLTDHGTVDRPEFEEYKEVFPQFKNLEDFIDLEKDTEKKSEL